MGKDELVSKYAPVSLLPKARKYNFYGERQVSLLPFLEPTKKKPTLLSFQLKWKGEQKK